MDPCQTQRRQKAGEGMEQGHRRAGDKGDANYRLPHTMTHDS